MSEVLITEPGREVRLQLNQNGSACFFARGRFKWVPAFVEDGQRLRFKGKDDVVILRAGRFHFANGESTHIDFVAPMGTKEAIDFVLIGHAQDDPHGMMPGAPH